MAGEVQGQRAEVVGPREGGWGDSRGKLDCPLPLQPLQTERQAGAECGLARQVGAEVSAGGGSRVASLPRSPRWVSRPFWGGGALARGRQPRPETGGSSQREVTAPRAAAARP